MEQHHLRLSHWRMSRCTKCVQRFPGVGYAHADYSFKVVLARPCRWLSPPAFSLASSRALVFFSTASLARVRELSYHRQVSGVLLCMSFTAHATLYSSRRPSCIPHCYACACVGPVDFSRLSPVMFV
jgi:hypothetical protein